MQNIYLLTDYKNIFGSKWDAFPYRSGFDLEALKSIFKKYNYRVQYVSLPDIEFINTDWNNRIVLYTSSEEYDLNYKSYIEDVVYGLKEAGAFVVPDPAYLRANNNKVFMELLRQIKLPKEHQTINVRHYGTYEELDSNINNKVIDYPIVIKKSAGAMSRGVLLAISEKELRRASRIVSSTKNLKVVFKEQVRMLLHKGYKKESNYQGKFITQSLVHSLKNDWKILIYGSRYYIFERPNRKNDFRASGSGYKNYIYGSSVLPPEGIFDYASRIFNYLDVPHLSLDICYDGKSFHLFEYQVLLFGDVGHNKSDGYYIKDTASWRFIYEKVPLEEVYVQSIIDYLEHM
jgi:hypothetical protein